MSRKSLVVSIGFEGLDEGLGLFNYSNKYASLCELAHCQFEFEDD